MKRALADIPNACTTAQSEKDLDATLEIVLTSTTRTSTTHSGFSNKRICKEQEIGLSGSAVEKLLSHLTNNSCGTGWKKALLKQFESPSFRSLALFVDKERQSQTIYPCVENTWTALNCTPLEEVRVVIVGQDPYHGVNQAHGLCFSVLPGNKPPPSLQNIYKELAQDVGVDFPRNNQMPNHGHLIRWAEQGVLLLNNVLTVRSGLPNSHQKRGWEEITDAVIRAVDRHCHEQRRGCVFLLWGKPATSKTLQLIGSQYSSVNSSSKQKQLHTVIATSHPSPLGARKTSAPFLGSRCFSRCNEALTRMGHQPIDWNLE